MTIFLPGFGADQTLWTHQLERFSDRAPHVIVLNEQESREAMVDTVLEKAPERFSLIGHSMGGWVAQAVAAKAGERLSKLILLNTWTRDNPQMVAMQKQSLDLIRQGHLNMLLKNFLLNLVPAKRIADDTMLLSAIQTMLEHCPPAILCRQLKAMSEAYETFSLLNQIRCPTLVIHSELDALFSLEEHQILASRIPHAQLALIQDSGHMTPLEKPEELSVLIRSFLYT